MEVYKASKDYHHEKLIFVQPAFAEEMDDTQRRVLKEFWDLDLGFLDEDELDKDPLVEGTPALRVARVE